ncbi:MAG: hypothetical protein LBT04_00105 [Prevotellaceae bacterium]|jgi:hypothetical protein|nr:hypothetical protein [Prevotellaceae bacterium]
MPKSPVLQFFIAFISGMIVPLFVAYIFIKANCYGDTDIMNLLAMMQKIYLVSNLIFIAILPNLIAVFLLNHFDQWNYLRGVFVSIMVYIAMAFLL